MKTKSAKPFDAVAMVRAIRDQIYQETKDLNTEERIRYFRTRGQKTASTQSVKGTGETEDAKR